MISSGKLISKLYSLLALGSVIEINALKPKSVFCNPKSEPSPSYIAVFPAFTAFDENWSGKLTAILSEPSSS